MTTRRATCLMNMTGCLPPSETVEPSSTLEDEINNEVPSMFRSWREKFPPSHHRSSLSTSFSPSMKRLLLLQNRGGVVAIPSVVTGVCRRCDAAAGVCKLARSNPTSSFFCMAFMWVWSPIVIQATAFDMRRVADALQLLFPQVKVVSLHAIASHTRESLTKQASLVTKEIVATLKTAEWSRISFISHSIGSLVLRLAIQSPILNPYRSKYHLFLSLNAPH